jgi:hypothetical protein
VEQRVLAGLGDLRVLLEIEGPVEQRMGIEPTLAHLGSLHCVVFWVEQAAPGDQGDVAAQSSRREHPPQRGAKMKARVLETAQRRRDPA